MPMGPAAKDIDSYIAEFPPEHQKMLQRLRGIIAATAPGATETISYSMPTFDLYGKHLVHFAAHTNHVGLYPLPSAMLAFAPELANYKRGKGSVQFPLAEPLPEDLVRRIVEFRAGELASKRG